MCEEEDLMKRWEASRMKEDKAYPILSSGASFITISASFCLADFPRVKAPSDFLYLQKVGRKGHSE